MSFLLDQVSLYEALVFLFVGVSGVAIGLGWRWVDTAMAKREVERSLENAMVRITRMDGEFRTLREEMGALREETAVIRAEFRMQGAAMLNAQRDVETKNTEIVELRRDNVALQRELIELKKPAAVNFNVAGDLNNGGDIAAHDKMVGAR